MHANLYTHADEKCVLRIVSWVKLYIGRKYDAAQFISTIKDKQVGYRMCCSVVGSVIPFVHAVMVLS